MRWSGYSTFAAVAIVAYGSVSSRAQTTRPAGPSYSLQDVVTAVTAAESLLPELRWTTRRIGSDRMSRSRAPNVG